MATDCSVLERLLSVLGETSQVCVSLDGRKGSTQTNHTVIQKGRFSGSVCREPFGGDSQREGSILPMLDTAIPGVASLLKAVLLCY